MTPATPVTVAASAERSTSGVGPAVDLGAHVDTLRLTLDVTAWAGTSPSLGVVVETSAEGEAWRAVRAFAPVAGAAAERLVFQPVRRYVRARWTIAGTGVTFTFSVTGEGLKPYATLEQFKRWHGTGAFGGVPDEDLEAALAAASAEADGELANRFTRPIVGWGEDLSKKVCAIGMWLVLSERVGFNPEAGSDVAVKTNADEARRWLVRVGSNAVQPIGLVDSAVEEETAQQEAQEAYVVTEPRRGW